ncbi:unnamed protein product [Effrenium voratum]|uniref:NADPH--hemoprotein reductase n=1 Tax=Effrenium voratum TaxID=2562239 RepID=A0AA36NGN3_9DINO|nr:unnamed protein product [Effrenium voratum]
MPEAHSREWVPERVDISPWMDASKDEMGQWQLPEYPCEIQGLSPDDPRNVRWRPGEFTMGVDNVDSEAREWGGQKLWDGDLPPREWNPKRLPPNVQDLLQDKVKVAGGLALGAAGLYLASRALKDSLHCAARREAASSFEYHLAVYSDVGGSWQLVKLHKAASLPDLQLAAARSLGLPEAEAGSLQFFPIQRSRSRTLGPQLQHTSALEGLLLSLPAEELQVIELVCAQQKPAKVPSEPPAFPLAGTVLPLMGTTYQLLGPYELPTYNLSHNLFPANGKFPYGPTVRSHSGRMVEIADFPEGTEFHPSARTTVTMTADAEVVRELIERTPDFPKLWNRGFQKPLQDFTANGLFTSSETSEDWKTGHALLPRNFNQIKVKNFAPQIFSKTRAFVGAWSNFEAGQVVDHVNDWLTAMTADAVVSCSMGLDMRNVERLGAKQPAHKFVDTFRFGLGYVSGSISTKSEYGLKRFLPFYNAQGKLQQRYEDAKQEMQRQVEELVEATRLGEMGNQNSVIRSMLDDRTADGKHVRYGALYGHVVNLMIAGHETTAATLGFTLQLLAENPVYEARALEEVRQVLKGRTEPEVDDVPKLQFVEQCFREALRIYSPVTTITRDVAYDTLLQGHRVYQGDRINLVTRALHTNPEYWGGEFGHPLSYNPDRFSAEAVKNRHPNAFQPWGFSTRSCIGSQFALFEAKTFLASILLHFRLQPMPGYQLQAALEGGAAPSAKDLKFMVFPRPGGPLWTEKGLMQPLPALPVPERQEPEAAKAPSPKADGPTDASGPLMKVLYGSNSGSSQTFASQVARAASRSGFKTSLDPLDSVVNSTLPTDGMVVIVTSTYNGMPPDNAGKFKAWLQQQKEGALKGLHFAVFGVGNSQWHTYQQFPREVDAGLVRCGGKAVLPLGKCDVDTSSFASDFEDWLANLMQAIGAAVTAEEGEDINGSEEFVLEKGPLDKLTICRDAGAAISAIHAGKAVAQKELNLQVQSKIEKLEVAEAPRELCQDASVRSVRHVTFRLPEGVTYRAGDHLEVMPPNDPALIDLVLDALGLTKDQVICWNHAKRGEKWRNDSDERIWSKMPIMYITTFLALQWFPNLAASPDRKICAKLARFVDPNSPEAAELKALADPETHKTKVAQLGLSLAELVHRFKGKLTCTLGELVAIAQPLTPRRYSISSSPDKDKRLVTCTVGQVKFTTGTGRLHNGLASTHLGNLPKGAVLPGQLRPVDQFRLPKDPEAPLLMVGPGTGLAPMMGFLQEREGLLKQKVKLGEATLFFGCRAHDQDNLYEKELAGHLKSGALTTLHVAFSREAEKVYVQDKIWENRAAVWKSLADPRCVVFVCGDARAMAPDVKRALIRVAESGGRSASSAQNLIAAMVEAGRYLEDVWA